MWSFWQRKRKRSRLDGVSEQLWSYDERRHKGWQLDTDRAKPRRAERNGRSGANIQFPHGGASGRQQERLCRYIGAGAMRHESGGSRNQRDETGSNPGLVWRLFAALLLVWWLCRLLPL